jgi:type II secretory pathway predicted ATPase ExeA
MYENHFGLKEKPFSLLPDPDYLLLGSKHRMAYNLLEYGLSYSDGFTVITGEIGCGKTTLVQQLLRSTGPQITFAFISDTIRLQGEILERVLMAFGLKTDAQNNKWTDKFKRFSEYAIDEYANGRRLVVIIDEAQNMDLEALEELRVLSNINSGKNLLVQIILIGQPELRQKLSDPRLQQFAQRIGKLYHLMPLDHEETREYIHHRITVAGGKPSLFTDEACEIIFASSGGVPRIINQLCDSALVYGYGMDKKTIDRHVLEPVLSDQAHAWTVAPTASPPSASELFLIHQSLGNSPTEANTDNKTTRKLPLLPPAGLLDLSRLDPDTDSKPSEHPRDETLNFETQQFGDDTTTDSTAVVRGAYYTSATSYHRQRFGLPMNGSVSDTEWLDIVCENDRARVKNLFTQYQKQDSNSFAVTTTIEDASTKRMLVDLTFESSENNVKGWLKKGSGNTNLKLNIEERFTASATNNI